MFEIEIVYATAQITVVKQWQVTPETTIKEALLASNFLADINHMSLENICCGIFSRKVSLDEKFQPGDRLEIYNPLIIEPKKARLKRVKQT